MKKKTNLLALTILTGVATISLAGSPSSPPTTSSSNAFFAKVGAGAAIVNSTFNPPRAYENNSGEEVIESLGNISTSQTTFANQISTGFTHEWQGGLILGSEIGFSKRYGNIQNNMLTTDDTNGNTKTNYQIGNRFSFYPKILIGKQTSQNTMLIFGAGAEFANNKVSGSSLLKRLGVNQLKASYSKQIWQIGPMASAEFDYSFDKHWQVYVEDDMAYFPSKDIGNISSEDTGPEAASLVQRSDYKLSIFKNDLMFGLKVHT
jgi:hypothetical protein